MARKRRGGVKCHKKDRNRSFCSNGALPELDGKRTKTGREENHRRKERRPPKVFELEKKRKVPPLAVGNFFGEKKDRNMKRKGGVNIMKPPAT